MTDRRDESDASAQEPQPDDALPEPTGAAILQLFKNVQPEDLPDPRTPPRSTPKGKVKASFNLLPEDLATIRALSEELGTTVTNVLQRAIRDQRFVREQLARGHRFAVVDPKGKTREIIWR
jgi:hypothetical protein